MKPNGIFDTSNCNKLLKLQMQQRITFLMKCFHEIKSNDILFRSSLCAGIIKYFFFRKTSRKFTFINPFPLHCTLYNFELYWERLLQCCALLFTFPFRQNFNYTILNFQQKPVLAMRYTWEGTKAFKFQFKRKVQCLSKSIMSAHQNLISLIWLHCLWSYEAAEYFKVSLPLKLRIMSTTHYGKVAD